MKNSLQELVQRTRGRDTAAGSDIIYAGDGADHAWAGSGDDVVYGEGGNDTLWGGNGDDVLAGGIGDDKLYGEAGESNVSAVYLKDEILSLAQTLTGQAILTALSLTNPALMLLLLNDNSIYGERGDTQWVGDGCKWIKANMIAANDTEERMAA